MLYDLFLLKIKMPVHLTNVPARYSIVEFSLLIYCFCRLCPDSLNLGRSRLRKI